MSTPKPFKELLKNSPLTTIDVYKEYKQVFEVCVERGFILQPRNSYEQATALTLLGVEALYLVHSAQLPPKNLDVDYSATTPEAFIGEYQGNGLELEEWALYKMAHLDETTYNLLCLAYN